MTSVGRLEVLDEVARAPAARTSRGCPNTGRGTPIPGTTAPRWRRTSSAGRTRRRARRARGSGRCGPRSSRPCSRRRTRPRPRCVPSRRRAAPPRSPCPLQDVLVGAPAPVAAHVVDELLAPADRAARVGHEDDVAGGGEDLRVPAVAPALAPLALRAAVDEDEQRDSAARDRSRRGLHHPGLHGLARGPGVGDALARRRGGKARSTASLACVTAVGAVPSTPMR